MRTIRKMQGFSVHFWSREDTWHSGVQSGTQEFYLRQLCSCRKVEAQGCYPYQARIIGFRTGAGVHVVFHSVTPDPVVGAPTRISPAHKASGVMTSAAHARDFLPGAMGRIVCIQ